MTRPSLRINDRNGGIKSIRRAFLELDNRAVKVGVLQSAGVHDPMKLQATRKRVASKAVREHEISRVLSSVPKVISPKLARAEIAAARRSGRWAQEEAKMRRKASILAQRPKTIAQIAFWNEYGTKTVPSRPAFRTAFLRAGKDAIGKVISHVTARVADGKITPTAAFDRIGLAGQKILRSRIVALDAPANRPLTIKLKGSSNPLVASGQLVRSINFEVVRGAEARRAERRAVATRGLTAPVRGDG